MSLLASVIYFGNLASDRESYERVHFFSREDGGLPVAHSHFGSFERVFCCRVGIEKSQNRDVQRTLIVNDPMPKYHYATSQVPCGVSTL